MSLALKTLRTSILGLVFSALLLFVPAGTLAYWPGWVFLVVFTIVTQAMGIYLARTDPALLARRMKAGPTKEARPLQRVVMVLVIVALLATVVLSALDWRFGWSRVPVAVIVLGNLLAVAGLGITFVVMRQNSFAGSTIETSEGQRVISTGLYGLVRHPMYLGAVIMSAGIPLALGSYWGLIPVIAVLPALVVRIRDEEAMLVDELAGYESYRQTVRSRLIPGVW